MLKCLRDDGFASRPTDSHALPLTDKTVNVEGVVARKSYLICLRDHEALAAKGGTELKVGYYEQYYKMMLRDPTVSAQLALKDYRVMLKDSEADVPAPALALRDALDHEAGPDAICDVVVDDASWDVLNEVSKMPMVYRSCVLPPPVPAPPHVEMAV